MCKIVNSSLDDWQFDLFSFQESDIFEISKGTSLAAVFRRISIHILDV